MDPYEVSFPPFRNGFRTRTSFPLSVAEVHWSTVWRGLGRGLGIAYVGSCRLMETDKVSWEMPWLISNQVWPGHVTIRQLYNCSCMFPVLKDCNGISKRFRFYFFKGYFTIWIPFYLDCYILQERSDYLMLAAVLIHFWSLKNFWRLALTLSQLLRYETFVSTDNQEKIIKSLTCKKLFSWILAACTWLVSS